MQKILNFEKFDFLPNSDNPSTTISFQLNHHDSKEKLQDD